MNYFGFTYQQAVHKIPYRTLIFLSASVPRYKTKEEREKENPQAGAHLFTLLGGKPE